MRSIIIEVTIKVFKAISDEKALNMRKQFHSNSPSGQYRQAV